MSCLGLDIGGANLKAADGCGWARSQPFALWRDPDGLAGALAALIEAAPPAKRLAVTMTGELCDSFRTKAEGVRHILDAVRRVAGGREISVYLLDGRLATLEQALEFPYQAAASNWHALAHFAGRFVEGDVGLLIDVGSTTTDIVPLLNQRPRPQALNDTDRLLAGELVYTGVGRTPICAITPALPWRGALCPVAAEVFATAADAYVILGQLAEQQHYAWSADGRPLTRQFARERLARMICADSSMFTQADADQAAVAVQQAQRAKLRTGIRQVLARLPSLPQSLILGGSGDFLAHPAACDILSPVRTIFLAHQLGRDVAACGPAHALAVLAQEV